MSQQNSTSLFPMHFILLGIPGLEHLYLYLALIYTFIYVTSVIENFTLLFIIRIERSLHKPMYFFLCMLSSIDIALSSSITPKMLGILWLNPQEIYSEVCLTQMFFLHSFTITESALLMAMAFDRYVAICNPLRYTSILTKSLIINIGVLAVSKGVAVIIPLPFIIKRLPFCSNNVIHHSYCDHMAVVKLACADITFNKIFGIVGAPIIGGLDITVIISSYVMILRAVFRLASREARFKAFGTCACHICAILSFNVPAVLASLVSRFEEHVPLYIHILLANVYLMLPSFINPIVYGVKTKQIRNRVKSIFSIHVRCSSNVCSNMTKTGSHQNGRHKT